MKSNPARDNGARSEPSWGPSEEVPHAADVDETRFVHGRRIGRAWTLPSLQPRAGAAPGIRRCRRARVADAGRERFRRGEREPRHVDVEERALALLREADRRDADSAEVHELRDGGGV